MDLSFLAGLCSPPGSGTAAGAALLGGLLLAGLSGSVMHCVPMCGPFVLGQAADRMARMPASALCEAARLRGALLLPYHAGRLITYAGLGAVVATLGAHALPARAIGLLLIFAALLFLAHAARLALPMLGLPGLARALPRLDAAPAGWAGTLARLARRLRGSDGDSWTDGLLLGLVLGFLPCGMLYGALAAAATTGRAGGGALAMLAFGLGTVPALIAVALAGQAAGRAWQSAMLRLAPAVMLLNAVVLAGIGVQSLA